MILSDAGRLWASRERPFSQVATHAGAEQTVDGDSLEALRAETDRQETFAREAEGQALKRHKNRKLLLQGLLPWRRGSGSRSGR
ncbi:hypothetical protein ACIBF6_42260 [Streptosporangium amethystogenes]|uniref:hypothetical protein n=1 Tax=Streptosporangium amethystogenes TaxID=2002 RepID=UPI003795C420